MRNCPTGAFPSQFCRESYFIVSREIPIATKKQIAADLSSAAIFGANDGQRVTFQVIVTSPGMMVTDCNMLFGFRWARFAIRLARVWFQ